MLLSNNYVDGYFYPRAYKTPHWKCELTNLKNSYFKTHKSCFHSCEKNVQLFLSYLNINVPWKTLCVCHIRRASNNEDDNEENTESEHFDVYWVLTLIGIFNDSGWMSWGCHHGHLSLHLLLNFFLLQILSF